MRSLRPFLLVLVLALALGGCNAADLVTDASQGRSHEFTAWTYFWGAFGGSVEYPGGPVARVEVSSDLVDLLVTIVTAGIVRPFSVEVWEAGG